MSRDQSIWLPADVTRCYPPDEERGCSICARALATIPATVASMADLWQPSILGGCANHLPVRRMPELAPEVRRVHPPLGSES